MPRIYGGADHGSYYYVDYTIGTQDVAGNWTDVSWVAGVHWGSYYFNIHDANMSITNGYGSVGGTTSFTYNSGWPIAGVGTNKDFPIYSGTTRVYHDVNGHGSIVFNGNVWWDTPAYFVSYLSGAIALPDIPRFTSPPTGLTLSGVTSTTVDVTFTDGTGGAPIDSRQIGYSTTNDSSTATTVSSDGSDTVTGLTPHTTYYFWARTHNSAGYSGWSSVQSTTTLGVPDQPGTPTISNVTQVSGTVSWTAPADNGSAIDSYEVAVDTTTTPPASGTTATSPYNVTGLTPGVTYYFWVRAHNAVGWSAWSPIATTTSITGARIKVGAVWKTAIPYVKDPADSTWKLARPWSKLLGLWKETI